MGLAVPVASAAAVRPQARSDAGYGSPEGLKCSPILPRWGRRVCAHAACPRLPGEPRRPCRAR